MPAFLRRRKIDKGMIGLYNETEQTWHVRVIPDRNATVTNTAGGGGVRAGTSFGFNFSSSKAKSFVPNNPQDTMAESFFLGPKEKKIANVYNKV